MKFLSQLSLGLGASFKGFNSIRKNSSLWIYILIPTIINLSIWLFLMGTAFSYISTFVAAALSFIFADPSGWLYHLVYYPLYLILAIGFLVTGSFFVFFVASTISSPFYSLMAEQVLLKNGVIQIEDVQGLKRAFRMFVVSLIKTIVMILIGGVLFLLSFLPGLNLIASFFAFVLMAFDCMDYSMETVGMNLSERSSHFRRYFASYSGLGLVIGLTVLIPGLTLFVMPTLVVGAAETFTTLRQRSPRIS